MKKVTFIRLIAFLAIGFASSAWAWTPVPTSNGSNITLSSALQPPPPEVSGMQALAGPVYSECNFNNFGSETGTTLVNHVKSVDPACLYGLFNTSSVSTNALSSSNMTTILNAARSTAAGYQGSNEEGMEQLVLFIRAGYYQASNGSISGYTSSHQSLVQAFISELSSNSQFYSNTTEEHGESLYEFMTMITNVDEEALGLPIARQLISNFNQTRAESFEQSAAVNAALNVLFYGSYDNAYIQAVNNDNSIVDALYLFLRDKDWVVGTNREYLYNNVAGELGRFLSYSGSKSLAKTRIQSILPTLTLYSPPWLKIAAQIDYITPSECGDYSNVCGYEDAAIAYILPIDHTCSSTLKMKVQDMTSAQLNESCDILAAEEIYFHNKLNTGNVPIAGDLNTDLRMVIFDSSAEYKNYGGPLFGIDTNNGGMYIEGNPSNPDNQASFYAHEAEWLLPEFHVWNLEHEYVHYLDGRFNLAGSFGAPTVDVVWWAEGLAEYISLQDDNQAAIDTITDGSTYTLQQVLETTYDGFVVDRIYRWGYLAVRFMFEAHPNEVTNYLTAARAGNWSTIQTYYNQWVSSYSNEFTQWTQQLASGGSSSGGSSSGGSSSGGSSSGGSSSGGSSSGGSSSGGSSSGGSSGGGITDACASESPHSGNGLTAGDTICVPSGSGSSSTRYFWVYVPSNTSSMSIRTQHGSGNASLYYRASSWATSSTFDQSSTNSGNTESITVNNPSSGYRYISVVGQQSGVSLRVDLN